MKARELNNLGIPRGEPVKVAFEIIKEKIEKGSTKESIRTELAAVAAYPETHVSDPTYGKLACLLLDSSIRSARFEHRAEPAPYKQWGVDLDANSIQQMENACKLPISVAGALMPDAHMGYGLPIGGVLATRNSVIPYAVGVDIACRMKLTVLDIPVSSIKGEEGRLRKAIAECTNFGVGGSFSKPKDHPVMDEDWSFSHIVARNKDKAHSQLGTSGSGNHFCEFGTLTLSQDDFGLKAGVYCALLSHSGSRGAGGQIATYYSKLAQGLHSDLPKELSHLAWLDLDSEAGQEYWKAMELMGQYAAANHYLIHKDISKFLGAKVLFGVENHHNFAWKENHFGEDVVVHRKGATPAGVGVVGVIPGSMATPGYVVRGKGVAESMNSASHGAGRAMSRTATKNSFTWSDGKKFLEEHGVTLISAGLDEVPMGYKDIESVMAAQSDLVAIVARFDPKLVKMAPEGERAEDLIRFGGICESGASRVGAVGIAQVFGSTKPREPACPRCYWRTTMKKKMFQAVAFGLRPGAVCKAKKLVGGRDDPTLMRREGLWLTNGGRVVKPGCGEYAREDFHDIPLLSKIEIECGIRMEEFAKRWNAAVLKWKRRERQLKLTKKQRYQERQMALKTSKQMADIANRQ